MAPPILFGYRAHLQGICNVRELIYSVKSTLPEQGHAASVETACHYENPQHPPATTPEQILFRTTIVWHQDCRTLEVWLSRDQIAVSGVRAKTTQACALLLEMPLAQPAWVDRAMCTDSSELERLNCVIHHTIA